MSRPVAACARLLAGILCAGCRIDHVVCYAGNECDAPDGGPCRIAVNEVQTEGNAGDLDEFIEIHSGCAAPLDLRGYRLVYESAAGVSEYAMVTFPALAIAAGGYVVCGQDAFTGRADVRYDASMASAGGSVGLRDRDGVLLDAVGWGTAKNALVERRPAPAPAAARSIQRIPDGHDTDDNAADLSEWTPTPGAANPAHL